MVHALEGMYAFALWDARREELLHRPRPVRREAALLRRAGGRAAFRLRARLRSSPGSGQHRNSTPRRSMLSSSSATCLARPRSCGASSSCPPATCCAGSTRFDQLQVEPYWTPVASAVPRSSRSVRGAGGRDRSAARALGAESPDCRCPARGVPERRTRLDAHRRTRGEGLDAADQDVHGRLRRRSGERDGGGAAHGEASSAPSTTSWSSTEARAAARCRRAAGAAWTSRWPTRPSSRCTRSPSSPARDVTVAIGGEGADELFGGYPRYRWLRRCRAARRALAGSARVGPLAAGAPRAASARRAALRTFSSRGRLLARHLDWVTAAGARPPRRLYGPALARPSSAGRARQRPGSHARRTLRMRPGCAGCMMLDQLHWLPDDVLVKADRAGMRVSLEVRTPYLNRELAEFAGTVPERVTRRPTAARRCCGRCSTRSAPAAARQAPEDRVPRAGCRLAARPAGAARRSPARGRERLR